MKKPKAQKISDKYWKAWSLVEGCTPVSEGCQNCWSAAIEARFHHADKYEGILVTEKGRFNGRIVIREDRLEIPLKTKKPTVFAIWNDLYHEEVRLPFIDADALSIMIEAKQHTFLILTKRAKRMYEILSQAANWQVPHDNIWHGVTCENQQRVDERIPYLLQIPGKKFLSLEPLLEKIDLMQYLIDTKDFEDDFMAMGFFMDALRKGNAQYFSDKIHAIIIGCETGPKARPCKIEWIESIVQQCKGAGVPCFVKAINFNGKVVKDIEKFPKELQIRQLPWLRSIE